MSIKSIFFIQYFAILKKFFTSFVQLENCSQMNINYLIFCNAWTNSTFCKKTFTKIKIISFQSFKFLFKIDYFCESYVAIYYFKLAFLIKCFINILNFFSFNLATLFYFTYNKKRLMKFLIVFFIYNFFVSIYVQLFALTKKECSTYWDVKSLFKQIYANCIFYSRPVSVARDCELFLFYILLNRLQSLATQFLYYLHYK